MIYVITHANLPLSRVVHIALYLSKHDSTRNKKKSVGKDLPSGFLIIKQEQSGWKPAV
jgi:hypothetical protein